MKDHIFSGYWGKCHCQGIAVDLKNGFIYYSFTTKLVKCDLEGNLIGYVDNIIGHLGCIEFNEADGNVYASLEYKNDVIGRGIQKLFGVSEEMPNGFYVAIFDVDKIDRSGMDAERDGIMRTVYLKTVVDDFEGSALVNGVTHKHIHGCSGIDGITIGPDFGDYKGEKRYLYVCYGVYMDTERTDNDYQVILQYEFENWWETVALPLSQSNMHTNGPSAPRRKYFLYTGNTNFGIQNFEYDEYTGDFFACVYRGKKAQFPNYPMFVIDGSVPAREESLIGYPAETKGYVLTLNSTGLSENGISGMDFPHGSTGLFSCGDSRFYVSEHFMSDEGEHATRVYLYALKEKSGRRAFEKLS